MAVAAPDAVKDEVDVEDLDEDSEKSHRHLDDIWQNCKNIKSNTASHAL